MDGELFGSFCEDYEGWTETMFKRVEKEYARELKRVLHYKGVATGAGEQEPRPRARGFARTSRRISPGVGDERPPLRSCTPGVVCL
jgi:hypothetical protein